MIIESIKCRFLFFEKCRISFVMRITMDNYIGKHLLIDCYNCKPEPMESSKELLHILNDAAAKIGMEIHDTFSNNIDDEIIVAAYGPKAHICIHSYPSLDYAAVDIYSFKFFINKTCCDSPPLLSKLICVSSTSLI